jgi:hypothetical protein
MTADSLSRRHALALLLAPLIAASCSFDSILEPGKARVKALSLSSGTRVFGDDVGTGDLPITLIGAGDQHAHSSKDDAKKTGAMLRQLLAANTAAMAFAVGDLAANGTPAEYQYFDAMWGMFKDRTFYCMGNHDRIYDPEGAPYYAYVGERGGPDKLGYYVVTLGNWRCYFLNSEHCTDKAQLAWLTADLQQNAAGYHVMAMWHTPMFGSVCGTNQKPMTRPVPLKAWWSVLQQYGCEFVVNGHAHRYERFAPMLATGAADPVNGIRSFTVGTGGVKTMGILALHPNTEARSISKGIVQYDLYPDHYEWKYTDLQGIVRDQGSQVCKIPTTV